MFTFDGAAQMFFTQNPTVYGMALVIFFIFHTTLAFCEKARRHFPITVLLMEKCTFTMGFMTRTITCYYETRAVLLALVITAIVCLAITIFSLQTKVDFTSLIGVLDINIVLFITGIITAIFFSFLYLEWLHIVCAVIGAIGFSLFLVLNIQLLLRNGAQSLGPGEYVYASQSLYISINHIYLFMLQIIGSRNLTHTHACTRTQ